MFKKRKVVEEAEKEDEFEEQLEKIEEDIVEQNLDQAVQAKNRKKDQERLALIKQKQKLAIEEIQEKSGVDIKKVTNHKSTFFCCIHRVTLLHFIEI